MLEEVDEQGLLRMQTVLCLVEDHGVRTFHDFVGDFLAPVRRKTVHNDGLGRRAVNQFFGKPKGWEYRRSPISLGLLSHAKPYVRIENVGVRGGLSGIVDHCD